MLAGKIIDGGSGVWGNIPMAAHSVMSKENAKKWLLIFYHFLNEISTNKTKSQLGINGNPETFTHPKNKMKEACKKNLKKRRKDLPINDLYQIIGQKIEIEKLLELNSFSKLYTQISDSLVKLNFIYKN